MKTNIPVIALLSLMLSLFFSCRKEDFSGSARDLVFSVDTLFFDTVFTEMGTATRNIRIYNPTNKDIRISRLQMRNPNSVFRLNADGLSGPVIEDIEILRGDSIFVFLEATIDPNGTNTPMVVEDALEVFGNNQQSALPVFAWGQDAVYIRPNQVVAGLDINVLPQNTTWTPEKPIVVFGYAVVDSAGTLNIQPGTQVHFHSGGGLWVFKDGLLNASGTVENPIVFQGDRLEAFYDELPGQWDRIWINESQQGDHTFKNCIVKNGLIGLQIEPLPTEENRLAPIYPNGIDIENVVLRNHSLAGILAHNYRIRAGNVGIYNCGQSAMIITGGGEYQMSHFTIANYWNQTVRSDASVVISNVHLNVVRSIENSYLENSIVTGTEDDEFFVSYFEGEIDGEPAPENDFTLRYSNVSLEEPITNIPTQNVQYADPRLTGDDVKGYQPDAGSSALNAGIPSNYPNDITGKSRGPQPDLGIFEID